MQWKAIRCAPHCHPWKPNEIPTEFFNRLQIRGIDVDDIFQIGLGTKPRVFGHKDGKIFYLIWYGADHKFWPTEPKNS
jgi:hypothetical protein